MLRRKLLPQMSPTMHLPCLTTRSSLLYGETSASEDEAPVILQTTINPSRKIHAELNRHSPMKPLLRNRHEIQTPWKSLRLLHKRPLDSSRARTRESFPIAWVDQLVPQLKTSRILSMGVLLPTRIWQRASVTIPMQNATSTPKKKHNSRDSVSCLSPVQNPETFRTGLLPVQMYHTPPL